MRRAVFLALFLSFSYLTGAFADDDLGASPDASSAGVLWVGVTDFANEAEQTQEALKSLFHISADKLVTVLPSATDKEPTERFVEGLEKALNSLDPAKDSTFFVYIDSHGHKGSVSVEPTGHKEVFELSHTKLLPLIFDQIEAYQKISGHSLTLKIFYDACFSGSLVPTLQKYLEDSKGQKFRVDLFTSSSSEEKTRVLSFIQALSSASKCDSITPCRALCNLGPYSKPQAWSSYRDLSGENQPLSIQEYLTIARKNPEFSKRAAIGLIRSWGPGALAALPTLLDTYVQTPASKRLTEDYALNQAIRSLCKNSLEACKLALNRIVKKSDTNLSTKLEIAEIYADLNLLDEAEDICAPLVTPKDDSEYAASFAAHTIHGIKNTSLRERLNPYLR